MSGAPWWFGLGMILAIGAVTVLRGRYLLQLWRDMRSGKAKPDDLWPPGRTIPDRPPAAGEKQPPAHDPPSEWHPEGHPDDPTRQ